MSVLSFREALLNYEQLSNAHFGFPIHLPSCTLIVSGLLGFRTYGVALSISEPLEPFDVIFEDVLLLEIIKHEESSLTLTLTYNKEIVTSELLHELEVYLSELYSDFKNIICTHEMF